MMSVKQSLNTRLWRKMMKKEKAHRRTEHDAEREPTGEPCLKAEREQQEEEEHDRMAVHRHDEYVGGDHYELTL